MDYISCMDLCFVLDVWTIFDVWTCGFYSIYEHVTLVVTYNAFYYVILICIRCMYM
jgi:hypothetical protein